MARWHPARAAFERSLSASTSIVPVTLAGLSCLLKGCPESRCFPESVIIHSNPAVHAGASRAAQVCRVSAASPGCPAARSHPRDQQCFPTASNPAAPQRAGQRRGTPQQHVCTLGRAGLSSWRLGGLKGRGNGSLHGGSRRHPQQGNRVICSVPGLAPAPAGICQREKCQGEINACLLRKETELPTRVRILPVLWKAHGINRWKVLLAIRITPWSAVKSCLLNRPLCRDREGGSQRFRGVLAEQCLGDKPPWKGGKCALTGQTLPELTAANWHHKSLCCSCFLD